MTARRGVHALIALSMGTSILLLSFLTAGASEQSGRADALARWAANGPSSYRIALRIEYRGETCLQQIEVIEGRAPRALRNTCNTYWLDLLTAPALFEMAGQIERIPQQRCYPSTRWCVCQRVFSARQIDYDPALGLPTLVLSRSSLRPNWAGVSYWERLLMTSSLPNCSPAPRRLTIEVVSLTPLP